jgi:type VI secretion system protein ImpG
VYLQLTDADLSRFVEPGVTLSIATTCINRDLPGKLPFGGGHPRFALIEGSSAVQQVECLTPPTATLRPPLGNGARWRLISHLALNHLSLMGDGATEAFREILRLYDFRDDPESQAAIAAVTRLAGRQGAARVPGRAGPVACQGVDVELELDPEHLPSGGGYLLAAVIQRFLALHVAINAYMRLTTRLKGQPRSLATWAPQTGDRVLI